MNELKNANQLDGYFKAPWWDNGKYRYSVPYGAGPTGIMWRKDKVKNLTNRWNDIWSTIPRPTGTSICSASRATRWAWR